MSRIWRWLAGAASAVSVVLFLLLNITQRQKDKALDKAEKARRAAATEKARTAQRRKADQASKKAKEEGGANVNEAVKNARTGKRDHFS